jgi:hypothetical protein
MYVDNLSEGSTEESVSDADAFYSEAEPVKPTVLAEEGETETELEEEVSEVDNDQPQAELEDDEEVQVFDKPNDFAKYEYDDESGLYEFKSMGKKVKVNTETLINSFQADQKLNVELENLAKAKKGEFEGVKAQELESLKNESVKFQELSAKLESLITETDEKIDWDELRDLDPSEYLKQKELQQSRKDALSSSNQERQAKAQERIQKVRTGEAQKLRESIPEWSDQGVMTKDIDEMRDHIYSLGFTQDEVDVLSDHRLWLMVKDSKELAQIKSKQVKEVKKLPTSIKSKRTPTTKKPEDRSDADIFYS